MPRPFDPAAYGAICGAAHVQTGADTARFDRDFTGKYTGAPLAVLRPANRDEVSAIMALAHARGDKILPMGGNTGLTGAGHAPGTIVLSLERMNAIRGIDPVTRLAVVEAGVIQQVLHDAAAAHGLIYPMRFGARGSCQIGGNLATNAGGSNVLRYGSTRQLCLGLEVVLADGRVLDMMSPLHKDNAGYDLRDLFIGSEGTLGVITAAVMRLAPAPAGHVCALLALRDLDVALDLLNDLRALPGGSVEAYEYISDDYLTRLDMVRPDLRPPLHEPWPKVAVLVDMAVASAEALPALKDAFDALIETRMACGDITDGTIAQSGRERDALWQMREVAAEITFAVRPFVDCDIALPLDRVAAYLDAVTPRITAIDADVGQIAIAHLGDGNIHFTAFPSRDDPALIDALRTEIDTVAVDMGGTFSAEHGVGLSKRGAMKVLKNPTALDVMRSLKAALDPMNTLNPGKLLP